MKAPPWLAFFARAHVCPVTQRDIDALRALAGSWPGLMFEGKDWDPAEFADRIEGHLQKEGDRR